MELSHVGALSWRSSVLVEFILVELSPGGIHSGGAQSWWNPVLVKLNPGGAHPWWNSAWWISAMGELSICGALSARFFVMVSVACRRRPPRPPLWSMNDDAPADPADRENENRAMKAAAPADLADHENENRAMVAAAPADPCRS